MLEVYETKWRDLNLKAALTDFNFNSHNDQDIISPYKIMQTSDKKKERYQLRDY